MWRNYEDDEVVFFKSKGINPISMRDWSKATLKDIDASATYNKNDFVKATYYNIAKFNNAPGDYANQSNNYWKESTIQEYNSEIEYSQFDLVESESVYYVSKIDNNTNALSDTNSWYSQVSINDWESQNYDSYEIVKVEDTYFVSIQDTNTTSPYWIVTTQNYIQLWSNTLTMSINTIVQFKNYYYINTTGQNSSVPPFSSLKAESFLDKQEGVSTSLTQLLSIIKSELWYNKSYGLPLYDKVTDTLTIDTAILNIVKSHKEVVDIKEFTSNIQGHSYSCSMKVNSIYGDFLLNI